MFSFVIYVFLCFLKAREADDQGVQFNSIRTWEYSIARVTTTPSLRRT